MASAFVQVHISPEDQVRVTWYATTKKADAYGVIELGNVQLYLGARQLDQLEGAINALQNDRYEAEGKKNE